MFSGAQIWDKKVRNGHIKRITDQDIQSSVLEIMGTNVSTNYITCPAGALWCNCACSDSRSPFVVIFLIWTLTRPQTDPGHQAAIPRDDHQEPEEVFHLRGRAPFSFLS